jgi:tRNA dimethylallyltransferase
LPAASLPRILVIVGPTASGKTSLSLSVARLVSSEIVSADSRQIYRYMDIGTAKPSPKARREVPHHFLDIRDPDDEYNAGLFGGEGRRVIREILGRGRLPVVVGGSGLYVRSLIDGLFDGPGADAALRERLEQRRKEEGIASLLRELQRVDPETARGVDISHPRRLLRALEVYHQTGVPISRLQREKKPEIPFTAVQVGIRLEREEMYARVNLRCDVMLESGLVGEVDQLLAKGYSPSLNSLNTVGYAEVIRYRQGKISEGEMVELFKRNTRRYAKRQMTWFGADMRIRWYPPEVDLPRTLASEFS